MNLTEVLVTYLAESVINECLEFRDLNRPTVVLVKHLE